MNQSLNRLLLTLIVCFIGLQACKQEVGDVENQRVADSEPVPAQPEDNIPYGQLPRDVIPTAYQLVLKIFPEEDEFNGKTTIDIELKTAKDHFYLHGKDLDATRVEITHNGETFNATYEQVDKSGIVKITSPRFLQGDVSLSIDYKAQFNQALQGLYKVVESGKSYAFTQFEAISARLAFPGFDEPGFKTPFEITMIVPENQVAITNTPEVSHEVFDGMKVTHFAPTKPLPTYLIAFAVGDLDVVEWTDLPATDIRPRPLPLRGIAVKGKGEQLGYALAGTEAIVTALESYFGTPYPWAKLDILAVPDFSAGAMENAGAITYRESLLLFDDNATPARQRRYKMVHAHELAHQWFGDLVTPVWWNDIWLNEAFATWMAHVAMDLAEPDGNYRRDLLSRGLGVMASDSLVNARKIRQPILSNNDISTAFDGITYSKGGAVLSMFETFLGRKDFRQGIINYMSEFEYGVATADDFIRHLAAASTTQPKEDVIESFNSFLEQPGLPLVEIATECMDDNVKIHLKQTRYFPLGSKGDRDQSWTIPVCMKLGHADESDKTCLLLTDKQQSFDVAQSCPDWIIPNADSAGYYRFTMGQKDWSTLLANSNQMNTNELLATMGSLTGVFNSGEIDVATLMSLAPDLISSPEWQVATVPIEHMSFMYDRMASEGQKKELESRFSDFYADKLEETGLERTDNRDKAQLQGALVEFLAETAKHPALREQLVAMALAYTGFNTDMQIHPEAANPIIIGTALKVAVDELGNDFVDHLRTLALASTDAVVRRQTLSAIGNTKDPAKAAEIRELVFSDQLRDNEISLIIYPQAFMSETRDASWLWLQKNLERILTRIPQPGWGRITYFGSAFCDTKKRAEVETFFADHISNMTGGPRTLAKTLESIELCVAKVEKHQAEMDVWLGQ